MSLIEEYNALEHINGKFKKCFFFFLIRSACSNAIFIYNALKFCDLSNFLENITGYSLEGKPIIWLRLRHLKSLHLGRTVPIELSGSAVPPGA